MIKQVTAAIGAMLMAAGWSGIVGAQEQTDVVMDTVVVSASRQEEKSVRIPAHVTVITADDIQKSTAQNVAEVLSTLGGVTVSDTGGNKRNYWVDLRGFGESAPQNLLLLVDGRRVNLPDLSGPDWNLVPLERIERIEVIRGGRGSILYGDNATQGVINIITKEGRKPEGSVTAQYGSYATFNPNGSVSGSTEKLSYDLTVGYNKSDGYRDNSETDARDIGTNIRVDPREGLRFTVSAGYHYDDTHNPGAILQSQFDAGADRTDTFSPKDFTKVNDRYIKTGLGVDMGTNDTFNLDLSIRNRSMTLYGSSPAYWFDADTDTNVFAVSPQAIFRGDFGGITNRVTLGADYRLDKQKYDNYSEYFGSPSQIVAALKKKNTAFYFQDELGVGDRLSISGGYRLDRVAFTYTPATPVDMRVFDEEGYNFGINYAFGKNSHVYGSYTHSFRFPVLDEQFYYFNSTVDTNIQPQTSEGYEIGGAVEVADGLNVSLTLFHTRTKDEIYFDFINGMNANMDGTTNRLGSEFGISWHWKALTLSGSYTLMNIDIDGGDYDGKEFPFVPETRATAKAKINLSKNLFFGIDAIHVGEMVLVGDFANEYDKVGSYTVYNAKLQYDWRRFSVFANFNNVFGEEYSVFSGLGYNDAYMVEPGYYPAPDFNMLVGVTARFGV